MKKIFREAKGITLIALVISVVVILILASITVNVTFGEKGLVTLMKQAEQNEILAEEEGQTKINELKEDDIYTEDGVVKVTDENGPDLEVRVTDVTNNSITIEVLVTEKESGIKKIEYSNDNGENYVSDATNPVARSYTFNDLDEGTVYNIRVRATDNEDNVTGALIKIKTLGQIIENNTPTIQVANNSKTTNSISVSATGQDADGGTLTYKLYTSTSEFGTYAQKASTTGTAGTSVTLSATGLSEYTTYYWYVTATDNTNLTATSSTENVRTYCSGTTYLCKPTRCSGGGYNSCTTCGGDGKISSNCSKCGGEGEIQCPGTLVAYQFGSERCSYCNGTCSTTRYKCNTCGLGSYLVRSACPYCGNMSADDRMMHAYSDIQCTTCSGTGKVSTTCTKCDGDGYTSTYNCKHGYWSSHYYCQHSNNRSSSSHYYCAHNAAGVQHD